MYEPSQFTWFWKKGHCNKFTSLLWHYITFGVNSFFPKVAYVPFWNNALGTSCRLANIPNGASLVIFSFNTSFQIWEHLIQTWEMLGMKVGDNGKTLDTMGNVKMLGDIRKKNVCFFSFFWGATEGCQKVKQC